MITKDINLHLKIDLKMLLAILLILSVYYFIPKMKESHAQTNLFSGTCGFLMNKNLLGWEQSHNGFTTASNFLGIINFDTGIANFTVSKINNYGVNSPSGQFVNFINVPFTMVAGPITGSYYLNTPNDNKNQFLIYPVNSGNSFLMVAADTSSSSGTGICQKV